jgi:hypothetical protein
MCSARAVRRAWGTRAEEIAEAVADHVVREAREIWAALGPAGEGR